MKICILKETKNREGRVVLAPRHVARLTQQGHRVLVQHHAGRIAGFSNSDYQKAGARIISSTRSIIKKADLILKVKEPTFAEVSMMHAGQIIFCYLHLAAMPQLLNKLLQKKVTALGFETLEVHGSLPLLQPMSEIAGKLATQNGAHFLRADQGGRGVLMGGTTEVGPANVLVLGAGVVGSRAAGIACGMGANVHVVDINRKKLGVLKKLLGRRCHVHVTSRNKIQKLLPKADLVVGAVLVAGDRAPRLVLKKDVQSMRKGSVIVDVAVDQGGCVETTEVTSHQHPIVIKYGVLHYGVPNMPGAVPVTATLALSQAVFPYVEKIAKYGLAGACKRYKEIISAINCAGGRIVHQALKGKR